MDLRQLEILRAIAESGSFTAAGARLHVSQSAISRQILLLEEEFKEPLFIRFGRRIQITPTGETLLQLSHRVFADIRDTSESILDTKKKLTGTLRLVGGMTVCLYVFPTLLKEFRRHHPDVDIKVITGGTPRLLRKLRSGAADLGLLTLPIDDPALATVPVIREELLLVMPAGHRLATAEADRAEALVRQPFILFESGLEHAPRHRRVLRRAPTSSRASWPRPRTSRSSSRWSPPASASASSPSSRSRGRFAAAACGRAHRGTDARARDRLGAPASPTACRGWCGR